MMKQRWGLDRNVLREDWEKFKDKQRPRRLSERLNVLCPRKEVTKSSTDWLKTSVKRKIFPYSSSVWMEKFSSRRMRYVMDGLPTLALLQPQRRIYISTTMWKKPTQRISITFSISALPRVMELTPLLWRRLTWHLRSWNRTRLQAAWI